MKNIAILDVCLPDYFTGYSKTVINVPIYSKTITHEKTKINNRLFYCLVAGIADMAKNYYCVPYYLCNGTKWNI